jgi:hypothetical protein
MIRPFIKKAVPANTVTAFAASYITEDYQPAFTQTPQPPTIKMYEQLEQFPGTSCQS